MGKTYGFEKLYRAQGHHEFREYDYKCDCHDCKKRRKLKYGKGSRAILHSDRKRAQACDADNER